jgi:membrane associated rhomboid family serine protease
MQHFILDFKHRWISLTDESIKKGLNMIVIPIGHESNEVRRLPRITFGIMALCFIIHIFISIEVSTAEKDLKSTGEKLITYYFNHPYLVLDTELQNLIFGEDGSERMEAMLSIYRQTATRPDRSAMEVEQKKLDELTQTFMGSLNAFPYRKWGFIPADKSFLALLTYMFIHGGWLHLFGNLLLLYLTGPFIEDLWGRPVYTAFYVIIGVLSALLYAQHYPNFTGPLIGASGAIAGVMGAFLVKYWKTKMRFFYWIAFFFRGTFEAPAFVMLPLWLLLEIFNAKVVDSINAQGGGVAHWAHVWGFVLGAGVALAMMYFKIEEKYIHPKIEAKIEAEEGPIDVVITAVQKKNTGMIDEAYALLLDEAKKNPTRKDVVDLLWDYGVEMGKADEAAKYFIKTIETEIRNNQMDVALNRFFDLKAKSPQAPLSLTYKLALLEYLTERLDMDEARKLADEMIHEINSNTSPVVLLKFATLLREHTPSLAVKVMELCLDHPEVPTDQKYSLKRELNQLRNKLQNAGDRLKDLPGKAGDKIPA